MNFRTTKIRVPIDNVTPNRWNYNTQTKRMFDSTRDGIKEMGFVGTITVRQNAGCYEILNGEHRWKALKELGYKEIDVEDMGEITDEEAKFWTIKLNEGGSADYEKLAKIYEELSPDQLSLLSVTNDEIENTKKLFKFDFSQYDKQEKIETKNTTLIQIIVPFEVKTLWLKCVEIAKENKESDVQLIVQMMEHYIGVNKGSSPGQREHVL